MLSYSTDKIKLFFNLTSGLNFGEYYKGENLEFGQHNIYFGYYLGVLATEYYLLWLAGKIEERDNTKNEVDLALNQWINYLDSCEYMHYYPNPNTFDGFFIRTDVGPGDFFNLNLPWGQYHLNKFNIGLTEDDDYHDDTHSFNTLPRGYPGYVDHVVYNGTTSYTEPMSQDEAIGLLLGLALIKKMMLNTDSYDLAQEIAFKVIDYIANHHGFDTWQIYDPYNNHVNPGGDAFWNSFGFAKAAAYFDYNIIQFISPARVLVAQELWNTYQLLPITAGNESNASMFVTLAAIGESWHTKIPIPVPPFFFWQNTTWEGIDMVITQNWEPFYQLLYKALHINAPIPSNVLENYREEAVSYLTNAPDEGPYFYHEDYHSGTGWSSSYRWHKQISDQDNGNIEFAGNYNGLDYMLMANLHLFIEIYFGNGIDLSDYHPYNNGTLNEIWPIKLESGNIKGSNTNPVNRVYFNSITSTSKIQRNTNFSLIGGNLIPLDPPEDFPGSVSYLTSYEIKLVPGFEAEYGANFNASIVQPIIFYNNFSLNRDNVFDETIYNFLSSNSKSIFDDKTTFIEPRQNEDSCIIYPNPTSGKISIVHDDGSSDSEEVCVYNSNNIMVFSAKVFDKITNIDLSFEKAGIYIVKIFRKDKIMVKKLIKY